jgi:hypothetical protein
VSFPRENKQTLASKEKMPEERSDCPEKEDIQGPEDESREMVAQL